MDDIAQARELERTAAIAQREGRYADAEAPLAGAIAIWERLQGPDDVEVLNCQMNLAVAYRRRGEAARGIPILERVVALLPGCSDPDVPSLLITARNNLAAAYRSGGKLALARDTWERCLVGIDARNGTAPHPERARVLDNLAVVLRDMGDASRSELCARRGLAEWLVLRGDDDHDTATSKATLGAALLEQNRLDEAEPFLVDSLRTFEATSHGLAVASTLTLLGALAAKRGDIERARAAFRRALVLTRERYPDAHPEVQELARSLSALGG